MPVLLILLGIGVLTVGAEILVRGASRLAAMAGVSPLVVGLTVVAFGTSAPELAVSVKAALSNQPDIALGNVTGSNIFNVLFILGISSLIVPLAITRPLVRTHVPIMIGVSVFAWVLALNGLVSRPEGGVLFAGILVYTLFLYWQRRSGGHEPSDAGGTTPVPSRDPRSVVSAVLSTAVGLLLLSVGARVLVRGAVELARNLGISELVIGATVVAAGTSIPEAATSVVASIRKEKDIAVGNIVGSNIFNLLCVLGCSALVSDRGIAVTAPSLSLHFPVMIATAVVCLPFFFSGGQISRWEGGVLLALYGFYSTYAVLDVLQHPAAVYAWTGLWTLVGVVVLVSAFTFARGAIRARKAAGPSG